MMVLGRGQKLAAGELAVLSGKTVLIVEDSWHIAEALETLLDSIGLKVMGPVSTLAAARRQVEEAEKKPLFAIVDLHLHGELAHGFVADLKKMGIHVIVTTGYEVSGELGGPDIPVLTKPIDTDSLLRLMIGMAAGQSDGPQG